MMEYTDKVMHEFQNPKNVGEIPDADGIGEVGSPACGDIMRMYLKISDDGIVEDAKFKTFGCGAAIATSSKATEMIKGRTVEEAAKLTNSEVVEELDGLPTEKIHCSVLAAQAIGAAIEDYHKRKGDHSKQQ
jgi:nitrogen fixation NifU-like protein